MRIMGLENRMMRFIAKQNGQNNLICDDKSLRAVIVIAGFSERVISCNREICIGCIGI